MLYQKYVSLCPEESLKDALYLIKTAKRKHIADGNVSDAKWFTSQPLGHNELKFMLKDMMAKAKINGHFTNHSLRVTTATRLFQNGVSEQLSC